MKVTGGRGLMNPITYYSDQAKDYIDAIVKCQTLNELLVVLDDYKSIFYDAFEAAPKNDEEFNEFITGLKKERRGKFAGNKFMGRYGCVLLPTLAMRVAIVSMNCSAPWGCAFIRLKEMGKIQYRDGIAYFID